MGDYQCLGLQSHSAVTGLAHVQDCFGNVVNASSAETCPFKSYAGAFFVQG